MIRAVVDPGVLTAGLISPTGPPAVILLAWREVRFDLIVCPMLLAEVGRALAYPKVRRYVGETEARRFLAALERGALILSDPEEIPSVSRDPNDDYLMALARDTGAHTLVSGDADLTTLADPIPRVLSPRQFLEALDETSAG